MAALKLLSLSRNRDVWVITFQVNAVTPGLLAEVHTALDQVEAVKGASAVVLASDMKVFSGGVDLRWWVQQPVEKRQMAPITLMCEVVKLMGRMVSFPIPIIAAIAGHCYAAGFMLTAACDHRVMSDKNAKLVLNEIDMGFTPHTSVPRLLLAKFSPKVVKDMLLARRILGPQEALATATVDLLAPKDQVLTKAIDWAQELASLGEKREAYGLLKRQMYGEVIELCAKTAWKYEEMVCLTKVKPKL